MTKNAKRVVTIGIWTSEGHDGVTISILVKHMDPMQMTPYY